MGYSESLPDPDKKPTFIHADHLDKGSIYPCAKSDVVRVFGRDRLDSIWFHRSSEWHRRSRDLHKPEPEGLVLAQVLHGRLYSSLSVFGLPRSRFNPVVRVELVKLLSGTTAKWLSELESRSETANLTLEKLVLALDSEPDTAVQIHVHAYELRAKTWIQVQN